MRIGSRLVWVRMCCGDKLTAIAIENRLSLYSYFRLRACLCSDRPTGDDKWESAKPTVHWTSREQWHQQVQLGALRTPL